MSTGGTTNKERARAQSRQALRVIEGFFFFYFETRADIMLYNLYHW
jgi:hypothetical protein